jgi:hypothetical protein
MIFDRTLVTPTAELPGRRSKTAKKVDEMFTSAPVLPLTVAAPEPQPHAAAPATAPSGETASTEVLITTQQVAFSTAAAAGVRRDSVGARLVASLRRAFVAPADAHPRRHDYRQRYSYLENSLMAREMERL